MCSCFPESGGEFCLSTELSTWSEAAEYCQRNGTKLLTVKSWKCLREMQMVERVWLNARFRKTHWKTHEDEIYNDKDLPRAKGSNCHVIGNTNGVLRCGSFIESHPFICEYMNSNICFRESPLYYVVAGGCFCAWLICTVAIFYCWCQKKMCF